MTSLAGVQNWGSWKPLQGVLRTGSKSEDRYSPPDLSTVAQRALYVKPDVPIGDGAARPCSVTASTMLMIKSSAVLLKEFFSADFTHLAVLCSTLFTTFFGVAGVKMVIDGKRECLECLRETGVKEQDWKGALMTGNRVAEGTIMIGIALTSLVTSVIYLVGKLGIDHSPIWLGDMLLSLSTLAFGVYTLFEWLGSFLESRKFRSIKSELREALNVDAQKGNYDEAYDTAIETNYQGAIDYLKKEVVVSDAEKKGLSQSEIDALTKAKEDLFSLYWGRELMLNVRDLKAGDKDCVKKAQAIVKEAVRWNHERCLMVRVNFCLFSLGVATVIGCVVATGGVPVIASALVMCAVSLILNVLNTRRVFLYRESKELGMWDERLLIAGMVFTVASMAAAVLLTGGGLPVIALFSVTGALILTLKGVALYMLHDRRKKKEQQVTEAVKDEDRAKFKLENTTLRKELLA